MDVLQRFLQDAVDEAGAGGADILHDIDRRVSWSPQQERIWTRLYGDGRGGVVFERLRHWSEGYSSYSRRIEVLRPDGMKRMRRLIADEIALVARLQRRDVESVAHRGTRYEPCPTTMSCHPVGLAVARHAGYPIDRIPHAALERVEPGFRALQDSRDTISQSHLQSTNLRRVRIRGEQVLFREIETTGLSYTDLTAEGPVLSVECDIPETMLVAMKGLPLAQIVDHPALDGLDPVAHRKVVRGELEGRPAIHIHLKRMTAPLATKENAA